MAKVQRNIIIQGLSGTIGDQLVIKQDRAGRTIVSIKPTFDEDRQFSEAQQLQQQAFQEATAYAKTTKHEAAYVDRAAGTAMSGYNVAVADWFHPPEIKDVDLESWVGQVGEAIRIKVTDDVQVTLVSVVITDETDIVLEQGLAVQEDDLWWVYTTTAQASGNPKVIVTAQDLPGHIAEVVKNSQA